MEKLLQILSKLPKWARIVVIVALLIAAGFGIFFTVPSCSSVRAVSYGDGRLSTTVNQSVGDSLQIVVHFNK